jgi:hypothetical protein
MASPYPVGDFHLLFFARFLAHSALGQSAVWTVGLSRENVMAQAANLQAFAPSMLQPGITINTSATDFPPIKQSGLTRFKGDTWELFGDVISAEPSAR